MSFQPDFIWIVAKESAFGRSLASFTDPTEPDIATSLDACWASTSRSMMRMNLAVTKTAFTSMAQPSSSVFGSGDSASSTTLKNSHAALLQPYLAGRSSFLRALVVVASPATRSHERRGSISSANHARLEPRHRDCRAWPAAARNGSDHSDPFRSAASRGGYADRHDFIIPKQENKLEQEEAGTRSSDRDIRSLFFIPLSFYDYTHTRNPQHHRGRH
ncbi:MAG: hypothetical protein QOI24_1270 [Acidobacteriota bacterium]|jgi:hypothetical protein|nr:hypothetical protein [Acidobacteriota bacterium]